MTETSNRPEIWFDLPALKAEWENNSSRVLKRDLIKQGYDKMMSLYGAVRNKTSKEIMGIRVEILSKHSYDTWAIEYINAYFHPLTIPLKYSIWIYEPETHTLDLRGVYP